MSSLQTWWPAVLAALLALLLGWLAGRRSGREGSCCWRSAIRCCGTGWTNPRTRRC